MRGFPAFPLVVPGVELPPPPPPPILVGVEFPLLQVRSKWVDFCDEEDEILGTLEKFRPGGVVTFLVDAPSTAKDISLPQPFSLSTLLEPSAATMPCVSTDVLITFDILDLPSTNGVISELPSTNGEKNILELPSTNGEKIRQAVPDMKVTLETERAAFMMIIKEEIGDLAVSRDKITDMVMA